MPAPSSTTYDRVEGLHLRQWALRVVPPLAVLTTNGAGFVSLAALPAWDAPLRAAGLPAATGTATWVAGAALVAASSILRVLAKGVLVRKTTVTAGGAYAMVRHPFYLANLVGAVGTFALAGPLGVVVALPWLAAALPVYLVTIAGEEEGLRRVHGSAWDDYAARVPRLLPSARTSAMPFATPSRSPPHDATSGATRVTWRNLVEEGEPPRGLRFLAGAAVVVACRVGGTDSVPGMVAAGAAAALWAGSHVVARCVRPRGA